MVFSEKNTDRKLTGLLASLTEQTKDFKAKYLDRVEEWAKEQAARNLKRKARYSNMITEKRLAICKERLARTKYPPNIAYLRDRINNGIVVSQDVLDREGEWAYSKRGKDEIDEAKMIKRSREQAEDRFEAGLLKMLDRIKKRNMIVDQCVIKEIKMCCNMEVTVTDGNKDLTLYAMIWSSQILRGPQYRYHFN